MPFQLTKMQGLLQKNINALARQRFRPVAGENDRTGIFPHKSLEELAGNRLLGLLVPREEGGEGAGLLDTCIVLEAISKECPVTAFICATQNLGAHLLSREGTPAQKAGFGTGIMEGKTVFGYAPPEGVSFNLDNVEASFSSGDGELVVNSVECFVANGDEACVICLFAREREAVQCLLVERGCRGLRLVGSEGASGPEKWMTCKAVLDGCPIPAQNRIGRIERGQEILGDLIHKSACFTAAQALGIAQGAFDHAVSYSRQREQFGRSISEFQAIRAMLADMSVGLEAARNLTYKAGAAHDTGSGDRDKLSCMAKYFASKTACGVTTDAVQIAGGYGYMRDYPLERMMRNALLRQVMDGSNHSHKLSIAKYLLGEAR